LIRKAIDDRHIITPPKKNASVVSATIAVIQPVPDSRTNNKLSRFFMIFDFKFYPIRGLDSLW
jgi:hypothetical protein